MDKYDTVVIGGGTSGIASAISSALKGFKTCIIEKEIFLSGTQAGALVTPFMPSAYKNSLVTDYILKKYLANDHDHDQIFVENIFCFNPEIFQQTMDQIMRELEIDIFYSTTVFAVTMDKQNITSVYANFLDQNLIIHGDYFIDASANLIVPSLLKMDCQIGDENQQNQAVSLRFEMANINLNKLREYLKQVNYTFCDLNKEFIEFVHVPKLAACGGLLEIFAQGVETGALCAEDIRYVQAFSLPSAPGLLNFNGPQIPNIYNLLDPLQYSKIIITGRQMQVRLSNFLKNNIPGFEDAFISKSASMLGIRESKRLIGDYILTQNDYLSRRKFVDGIARGDWYIDIHNDSLEVEGNQYKAKFEFGEYYEIPYRSLVTKKINNCLFVGRHISSDFKMQSSIRIQYTCYAMGNIVGNAIALAKKSHKNLNEIDGSIIKQEVEAYLDEK